MHFIVMEKAQPAVWFVNSHSRVYNSHSNIGSFYSQLLTDLSSSCFHTFDFF